MGTWRGEHDDFASLTQKNKKQLNFLWPSKLKPIEITTFLALLYDCHT